MKDDANYKNVFILNQFNINFMILNQDGIYHYNNLILPNKHDYISVEL